MECEICGDELARKSPSQRFCSFCSDERRKEYQKLYWKDYKSVVRREKLGNPKQDIEILRFIRRKRQGLPVNKYDSLYDSEFK